MKGARRPWFAWVHYFDPHAPYEPPADLQARFAASPYDGEIASVDRELGALLKAVDTDASPAFVLVTSDHGESLGEHGEATHGVFVYDATLRVPWIMAGPGMPQGQVSDVVARGIDVLPTLVDLIAFGRRVGFSPPVGPWGPSVLFRLRSEYQNHERDWLVEQLHTVVERLLTVHRKTCAETERLDSVRPATREELYRRISRARDYMSSKYAEPVTLSQLARVACLSPNHLLRTFRKVFGGTPHRFLTERRLQEAKRLLADTELSVTDICLACGFESLGSFSSLFRKQCGSPPSEYRETKR
jgi:AraC-like DNA-binding protein